MYYISGSGRIELQLTMNQALTGSHTGDCEADIKYLRQVPAIKRQLKKLDPETVAKELAEFGCWTGSQLAIHDDNLTRILWIACCDIADGK